MRHIPNIFIVKYSTVVLKNVQYQVLGHLLGNGSYVFLIHDQCYAYYGEVRLSHLFILALLGQVMGHMYQVMKKQSIKYDQGYAYYRGGEEKINFELEKKARIKSEPYKKGTGTVLKTNRIEKEPYKK